MSSFGGAAHSSTLGKRIQVVARVRKELNGETIDSDLNVSGNGCKITLIPPAKSKSDRRTEFLFDDVFVPDCRPEDLYAFNCAFCYMSAVVQLVELLLTPCFCSGMIYLSFPNCSKLSMV